MTNEQERAEFEAWAKKRGYDMSKLENGVYANDITGETYIGWQARAALQSQDREDAERWRYWKRWWMNSGESGQYPPEVDDVWHRNPDFDFDEAIDHARRAEGDGE